MAFRSVGLYGMNSSVFEKKEHFPAIPSTLQLSICGFSTVQIFLTQDELKT
jgi:hypothetical protein